jgi:hypothetical protein
MNVQTTVKNLNFDMIDEFNGIAYTHAFGVSPYFLRRRVQGDSCWASMAHFLIAHVAKFWVYAPR